MTKLILWVSILFSASAYAQTSGQLDAFNAGKAAGSNTSNQAILDNINHTQAGNAIGSYTTNLPEQSAYWGGANSVIGPLYSGGNSKINQCGNGLSSTSTTEQQHCEAINAVVNTQAKLPTNLITRSDPIVLKGTAIASNPDAIAGAINSNYSGCRTDQITKESAFTLQTCDDWSESGTESCKIGQSVVVDPDYLYRCKETISTINNGTCTYGNTVVVDVDYSYRCESNVQKTVKQACQKIAVLTIESTSAWGGAGQLIANPLLYVTSGRGYRTYAEIYANVAPNTYTLCMQGSRTRTICDANVINGKYVNLVSSSDYHAMWGTVVCAGNVCNWSGTGNFGCYGVPGCKGGVTNFNIHFTAPESVVATKKIAWQSNCTALEAAAQ